MDASAASCGWLYSSLIGHSPAPDWDRILELTGYGPCALQMVEMLIWERTNVKIKVETVILRSLAVWHPPAADGQQSTNSSLPSNSLSNTAAPRQNTSIQKRNRKSSSTKLEYLSSAQLSTKLVLATYYSTSQFWSNESWLEIGHCYMSVLHGSPINVRRARSCVVLKFCKESALNTCPSQSTHSWIHGRPVPIRP